MMWMEIWDQWKIVIASALWGITASLLWARGDEAIVIGMIAFPAAGAPFMLEALRRQLCILLMLVRIEDRLGPGPVVANEEEKS